MSESNSCDEAAPGTATSSGKVHEKPTLHRGNSSSAEYDLLSLPSNGNEDFNVGGSIGSISVISYTPISTTIPNSNDNSLDNTNSTIVEDTPGIATPAIELTQFNNPNEQQQQQQQPSLNNYPSCHASAGADGAMNCGPGGGGMTFSPLLPKMPPNDGFPDNLSSNGYGNTFQPQMMNMNWGTNPFPTNANKPPNVTTDPCSPSPFPSNFNSFYPQGPCFIPFTPYPPFQVPPPNSTSQQSPPPFSPFPYRPYSMATAMPPVTNLNNSIPINKIMSTTATTTSPRKKLRSYCRKDKSLGIICENFVARYGAQTTNKKGTMPSDPNVPFENTTYHPTSSQCTIDANADSATLQNDANSISIDSAAADLCVEPRRIYDIINILESIDIVRRKCKKTYNWQGRDDLPLFFAGLQKTAVELWPDDAKYHNVVVVKEDDNCTRNEHQKGGNGDGLLFHQHNEQKKQKKNSLGRLTHMFLQLFLVGNTTVSLAFASEKLLGLAAATSSVVKNGSDLDTVNSKKRKALTGTTAEDRGIKTKVRRLYDIANVLSSIGIISKLAPGGMDQVGDMDSPPLAQNPNNRTTQAFKWNFPVLPQDLPTMARKMIQERQAPATYTSCPNFVSSSNNGDITPASVGERHNSHNDVQLSNAASSMGDYPQPSSTIMMKQTDIRMPSSPANKLFHHPIAPEIPKTSKQEDAHPPSLSVKTLIEEEQPILSEGTTV